MGMKTKYADNAPSAMAPRAKPAASLSSQVASSVVDNLASYASSDSTAFRENWISMANARRKSDIDMLLLRTSHLLLSTIALPTGRGWCFSLVEIDVFSLPSPTSGQATKLEDVFTSFPMLVPSVNTPLYATSTFPCSILVWVSLHRNWVSQYVATITKENLHRYLQ